MGSYERKEPQERFEQMVRIALALAEKKHFLSVTPSKIGEKAGVTRALVSHYFGTLDSLHAIILREAIKRGIIDIIEQGQRMNMVTGAGRLKRAVQAVIKNN